jgi:hypothetical protein
MSQRLTGPPSPILLKEWIPSASRRRAHRSDGPSDSAALIEDLDGACVQPAGARAGEVLAGAPLDDGHVDPRRRQLARHHQPGRPSSGEHPRTAAPGASSGTASPATGSTPPRDPDDPYADHTTRISRPPFPPLRPRPTILRHGQGLAARFAAIRRIRADVLIGRVGRGVPPFGRHRRAVEARSGPVALLGFARSIRERGVQPVPAAGLLPVAQAPPAGHAAAAAHLLGQVRSGDAGLEHEQDARERRPIRPPRATRLLLVRPRRREPWFHHRPQLIGHQRRGHAAPAA